ncbi:G5 domain-containing protein [Calidifontibacillus erzurumensis]|uniref:G5 domain-containing protein n=1 Tax=Calidifontibacillus erzurumensis TaxID=2741433 RepID=UPI0035B53727
MNKVVNLKLFGLLIACTSFIMILSYIGTKTIDAVFHPQSPEYSSGTMIGPISLDGMTEEQAESEVATKIAEWSKTSSLSFQYQNKIIELPDHIYSIDVNGSVQRAKDGQKNDFVITIDKKILDEEIQKTIDNQVIIKDLDINKLEQSIIETVNELRAEPVRFQLLAYLKTDGEIAEKELAVTTISGIANERKNLEAILGNSYEFEIAANDSFSFKNTFGSNQPDSDAYSIIASAIYEVILPTNFMIIERNISRQLPPYSKEGEEAKVSNKMDLIFNNPNPYSYKILMKLGKDQLQAKLIGPPFPYNYAVKKETESYSPRTVLQFSAKLSPGQTKVLDQGKKGLLVKVYRETKDDNNQVIETTFISEDFYPPNYRIVQTGLMPSEKATSETENKPANTQNKDMSNEENEPNVTDNESTETDEETSSRAIL